MVPSSLRVVVVVAAAFVTSGCNPKVVPPGPGGCTLNSDCNSPLVCVFGACHDQCVTQYDCPNGQLCVLAPSGSDHVCQLPNESSCVDGGACPDPLTCASDMVCRTGCSDSGAGCLMGQVCQGGACYSSTQLDAGGADAADADATAAPDAGDDVADAGEAGG